MGVRVKRGKNLFRQNEEERQMLDALVEHLSRLEGVWAYHADGRFQIRHTPLVVIAKKRTRQVSQTTP